MTGRHATASPDGDVAVGRRRRILTRTGVLAAAVATCAAGAVLLAMAPANAAGATDNVQLTLSGVADSNNPTGGSKIGVHPGDNVVLTAAAVPTAGAPGGLGNALAGLIGTVASLQVKITDRGLPGVPAGTLLGKVPGCGGTDKLTLNSLGTGTYTFHYQVEKVGVLTSVLGGIVGCNRAVVTPSQDQLGVLTKNNVKFSDTAGYTGQIVAATNPPGGQLGVQFPSQSISVKAGPIHTSVKLPGATIGVTNPVPAITSKVGGIVKSLTNHLTGGGKNSTPAKGGSSSANVKYTPPPVTVPQQVMPHAVNFGGTGSVTAASGGFSAPGAGSGGGGYVAPNGTTSSAAGGAGAAPTPSTTAAGKPVDLSSRDQLGGQQLPALLAIAAILALSLVTAAYARMVLLRRSTAAK